MTIFTGTLQHAAGAAQESRNGAVASQLGDLMRDLHQTLRALGAMSHLQRAVQEFPDARSRLAHVGEMTESAAHRVLNFVDASQFACNAHARQAVLLAEVLERNAQAPELGRDHARRLLASCGAYARDNAAFAAAQSKVLGDIQMAQDFQDLSGQVINKVIDIISRAELQLLALLDQPKDGAADTLSAVSAGLRGPQTPDKALAQDDVDKLLASLDF